MCGCCVVKIMSVVPLEKQDAYCNWGKPTLRGDSQEVFPVAHSRHTPL